MDHWSICLYRTEAAWFREIDCQLAVVVAKSASINSLPIRFFGPVRVLTYE